MDWRSGSLKSSPATEERDWDIAEERLREIPFNGVWASYTTLDMLHKVCKLPVTPWHVGNVDSPKQGLRTLGFTDIRHLLDWWEEHSLPKNLMPFDTPFDCGVLESLCCDWNALRKGRFYAGRSIDRMQDRIKKVEDHMGVFHCENLWDIRREVFPMEVLGECMGWDGIDRARLQSYKTTGEIAWAADQRNS